MSKEIKNLIKKIEEKRQSNILVYFTGDRIGAFAQIGEDAVRIIYDHLLNMRKTKKIELFLYSRGGDVSVPWRIVSMIREFCEEFNVIIPYNAHSAATLISLGADKMILSKKAELSPVDPTLTKMGSSGTGELPEQISVEDIKAYLNFIKERVGITDQLALSQNIAILTNKITPLIIGKIDRLDHHIKLVARKLITSRNERTEESKINSIVEVLTEKIYSHGHAIGRKEAKEMGLPVKEADNDLEEAIWKLYLEYEKFLNLQNPLDPQKELGEDEKKIKGSIPMALVESLNKLHVFEGNFSFNRIRNIPQDPQVNISLNLNLPSDILLENLEESKRKILEDMTKEIHEIIPEMIHKNLMLQSPEIGIESRFLSGKWVEK